MEKIWSFGQRFYCFESGHRNSSKLNRRASRKQSRVLAENQRIYSQFPRKETDLTPFVTPPTLTKEGL